MQTAVQLFSGSGEDSPAKQASQRFDYEAAIEKQRQEGGPRRFFEEGELDIDAARVADEHGNPVEPSKQPQGYEGR